MRAYEARLSATVKAESAEDAAQQLRLFAQELVRLQAPMGILGEGHGFGIGFPSGSASFRDIGDAEEHSRRSRQKQEQRFTRPVNDDPNAEDYTDTGSD